MNNNRTKLILLVFLITKLNFANTQSPKIKEEIRYNQGLSAKKDSLISLNISAAINFKNANNEDLIFETNWGEIKREAHSISLPEDYKGAEILLTDTDNGFLNIVAFNRESRRCLVSLIYEENQGILEYKKDLIFSELSLSECLRVRISRYGEMGEGRLISYITDSGIFKWIARPKMSDEERDWKSTDTRLFDEYLDPNEYHQVQTITSFTHDLDFFYLYQKSGGKNSQVLFKKMLFFYSDANIGTTNSTSILTLKVGEKNFFELTSLSENNYELENVNWKSRSEKDSISGYWLIFKNKNKGGYKTYYGVIDNDYNFEDSFQANAILYYERKEFAGTGGFQQGKDGTFSYYYSLNPTGRMKLCIPKFLDYVFNIYEPLGWEYNCLEKSIPGISIEEDEYIDHVTIYSGKLAVVTLRSKGNPKEIRNIIYNFLEKEEITFDLKNSIYIANKLNIYELPRIIPKSGEAQITIKKGKENLDNLFLIPGSTEQPVNPNFSISDKREKITHNFKLNFMGNFVEEYVEFNEFYLRVKESEKRTIITDPNYIRIRAEYVKSYDQESPDQFFYVTPFILQSSSDIRKLDKVEHQELKESEISEEEVPNERNYPLICEINQFYLFANKLGEAAYYAPKSSLFTDNIRYMILKIKPTPLKAKEFRCFSNYLNGLFIGREENKDIYSVMSISDKGDYYIREFYSKVDLLDINSVLFNEYAKVYTLKFNNGSIGFLNFEKLYPIWRVDGATKGKVSVEGLAKEIMAYVTYEEDGDVKKMRRRGIVE